MKAFWIIVSALLIAALINWVRSGSGFHIVHALPLLGGDEPWGIGRVVRRHSEP